jgi:hypothetical protein
MNNKTVKIIYWITTSLLALFIIPGVFFINSKIALNGITHMQIPKWLSLEVGYGQPIGALLLILPFISPRIKEWAYVALGIVYISALVGHLYIDGFGPDTGMAVILFIILVVSYICYHKIQKPAKY